MTKIRQQPTASLDLGGAAGLLGGQGERPGFHRRRGTSAHRAAGHPAPAAWATLPSTATSRVFRRGRRARRRSTRRAPLVAGRVAERRDPIVVIYAVSAAARSAVPARRRGSGAAHCSGARKASTELRTGSRAAVAQRAAARRRYITAGDAQRRAPCRASRACFDVPCAAAAALLLRTLRALTALCRLLALPRSRPPSHDTARSRDITRRARTRTTRLARQSRDPSARVA